MNPKYQEMLHMPHHVSLTRPQMSLKDRAAQFSPFAALTGYEAAVKETARLTEQRIELDDSIKVAINETLSRLFQLLKEKPRVELTYYCPDGKKEGGAYHTFSGTINKINTFQRTIILEGEIQVPMEDIMWIEILD